jgi:Ca2+-transporting ATPase
MQTQIGLIAEMIQSYEEEATPLQRRLDQFGRWLGWGALAICALVFIVAVCGTRTGAAVPQGPAAYFARTEMVVELFLVAVSLAIAAVPEGCPRWSRSAWRWGCARWCAATPSSAACRRWRRWVRPRTICSDKTGTLTQNQMTVVRLYVANLRLDISEKGYQTSGSFDNYGTPARPAHEPEAHGAADRRAAVLRRGQVLEKDGPMATAWSAIPQRARWSWPRPKPGCGARRSSATAACGRDPVRFRPQAHDDHPPLSNQSVEGEDDRTRWRAARLRRLRQRRARRHAPAAATASWRRGQRSPSHEARRQHIENVNRDLGGEACACWRWPTGCWTPARAAWMRRTVERDLTLIGLVAMTDPARPEVAPAVEKAHRAGIRTMMITGDYPDTARAIAEQIGLLRPNGEVVTGAELNQMTDEELVERGRGWTSSPASAPSTRCASSRRSRRAVTWWR